MIENYACGDCMYWEKKPRSDEEYGWCRRSAPRPITFILTDEHVHESYDVQWPETSPFDWCGEFRAAE